MYTTFTQFFSLSLWFLDSAGKEELTQPKVITLIPYTISTQERLNGEERIDWERSLFKFYCQCFCSNTKNLTTVRLDKPKELGGNR